MYCSTSMVKYFWKSSIISYCDECYMNNNLRLFYDNNWRRPLNLWHIQARIQNLFTRGRGEEYHGRIVFYRLPKTDILKFTCVAESTRGMAPCSPLGFASGYISWKLLIYVVYFCDWEVLDCSYAMSVGEIKLNCLPLLWPTYLFHHYIVILFECNTCLNYYKI
jgi:hypothetical protein